MEPIWTVRGRAGRGHNPSKEFIFSCTQSTKSIVKYKTAFYSFLPSCSCGHVYGE